MKKALYFECNAGISGDMTVAALLDLGADEQALMKVLTSIPINGFKIEISRVQKSGIDCCDFNVVLDTDHENYDHDMAYLHGCEHHAQLAQSSGHHHEHHAHHTHTVGHHHEHRGLSEILSILNQCQMTDSARILAEKIFRILAEAEAKAHALPIEQIHFHEVGAIDSIIDIISTAVCFDNLGIEEVIIPKLCEGQGTVRCQHGILPIPVPATANILSAYHLPVEWINAQGEFVTPTGAAIAAALRTRESLPQACHIRQIGIGAGKRSYERPSLLRIMQIDITEEAPDTIVKLESNIDDCTGEALGYVMDLLFSAGAKDVHYMPVFMKKNRPGWQLNVICDALSVPKMEQIIFQETTTIGIRRQTMKRTILPREILDITTSYGTAKVKICHIGSEKRYYPEYESVAAIAQANTIPYPEAYDLIQKAAIEQHL